MLNRYLFKRKKSALWQLRVPVPADVQAVFGRKEVTRSTGEHDRVEAAKVALPIISALNDEWQLLRANGRLGFVAGDSITPRESDTLALAWNIFENSRATVGKRRSAIYAKDPERYDDYRKRQDRQQRGLIHEFTAGDFARWEEAAERVLQSRGFQVDRESPEFKNFAGMVAEATISAIDVENRREGGDLAAKPSSDVLQRAKETVEKGGPVDISLSALADSYLTMWRAERIGKKDTNTEHQKRATFKLFGEFWGDKPIRGVGEKHAAEFRDKLKLLHPNWSRSPAARKMNWRELQAAFGNQNSGLSASTMNRHMATLQSLWAWARKRGHCEGDNPFADFHVKIELGKNSHSYLAWENDELKRLFNPPPRRSDLAEVMIVGMFTGMRLDEIASLTWSHVRTGDGITYFQIDDAKTPAGIRQVPVHHSLGWLLDRKRGKSDERIWANFNPEGPGKKPGADASREFSRHKAARGFDDRRKTFHSFRKNVTRIMEQAQVPENEWAQVFGHERGFTYRVYNPDGITLRRKAEIIRLIDYPGLSIPHPKS